MTIARMASIIKTRRRLARPLTPSETDALVAKLIPIIVPEQHRIEQMLRSRMAFLPMHDLVPEESSAKWN